MTKEKSSKKRKTLDEEDIQESKKQKTNGTHENGNSQNGHSEILNGKTVEKLGLPKYQDGSIVKMTVHNFMTYDDCCFEPGPGLNLVLGPNGTGKSSIVSAICVGLAGNPKLLGRASKVKDYIKHGKDSAFVEVELYQEKKKNAVLRRSWKKNSAGTEWKLNGKTVKQEFVENFIKKQNIKLDNLTQFLPQDKVCEFAGLGPVDLLEATEGAVLPPEIVAHHKDLTNLKNELNVKEQFIQDCENHLTTLKKKNEMLERDVERFKQRENHLLRVEQLELKVPYVQFTDKQKEAKEIKTEKENAEVKLETYRSQLKPLLDQIQAKKSEVSALEQKRTNAKKETKNSNNFDSLVSKLENLDQKIDAEKQNLAAIHDRQKQKEYRKRQLKDKISHTKSEFDELPEKAEIDSKVISINREMTDIDKQIHESGNQIYEVNQKMETVDQEKKTIQGKIKTLDNIKYQRLEDLKDFNYAAYESYRFYEKKKEEFRGKVLLVPLEISIPNRMHAKYLELQCPNNLLSAFICTDKNDREILIKEITDRRKLNITVIVVEDESFKPKRPCSLKDLEKYGITHFLDETFEAPDIVKNVMDDLAYISGAAVGSDQTISCVKNLLEETNISTVFTPQSQYVSIRSKYGNKERSTRVSRVNESRILTGVDLKQKEELKQQLHRVSEKWKNLQNTREEMQKHEQKLVTKRENLSGEQRVLRRQLRSIEESKKKIEIYEEQLNDLDEDEDVETKQKHIFKAIRQFNTKRVELVKKFSESMKKYHQAVLKESTFPFETAKLNEELKNLMDNSKETEEMHQQLKKVVDDLQTLLDEKKTQLANVKKNTIAAKERYMEKYEKTEEEVNMLLLSLPEDLKKLQQDIDVERSSAEAIYHDPTVIQQYEARKIEIAQKETQLQGHHNKLSEMSKKIDLVKELWLPELQKCVLKINETFTQYCKNIGIVGEVHLIPNDDFAKYEIQIKVKFRDSESLSTLSTFRQSGGERSVTTILYLLALQGLNKCPLRVVDEINQGMDPVNERKIFLQMLESSRGENVPQAFLITPKLLPDLVPENTDNITVLFIFNGPYNITQEKLLKDLK
eukprot:gene3347-5894_t